MFKVGQSRYPKTNCSQLPDSSPNRSASISPDGNILSITLEYFPYNVIIIIIIINIIINTFVLR